MPRNKDLKRLVRTRMQKTGEAYTTARAHITRKRKPKKTATQLAAVVKPEPEKNYADLAGFTDAIIKEKTGCTWERWVSALDHAGAAEMSHGEIARYVNTKYNVAGWWSQAVTVGYERIKGLRARGQRLDGSYEASKSRTFNVPVQALFDSWADARTRKRWLNEPGMKVRTSSAPKSMRIGWSDGTIIAVWFTAKGNSKSSVALAHTKLPNRETAERLKQYWTERLDTLGEVLKA